jgi:FAD/FMN-containing dehydrogenase/Fe-S oxidoreductase
VETPPRERVRDDLKGVVKGELLFDDLSRTLYSTDASIFEVRPLGVVVPRDEEDVQVVTRYAGEHQVPIIARGAGTGVAGEALGPGLVLDLSRHFRAIVAVGADTVTVQPGVTYRTLAARLNREGRRFAPDPAHADCTIGGMLANNASGARVFRHGFTRDHVVAMRAVLDSGDAAAVAKMPRVPAAEGEPGRLQDIVSSAVTLLSQNGELIAACRPRTRFDRCGYQLHDVLGPDHLDLARLLVGSEGTLALFTETTLRTVPLPGGRSVVLLGFDSLDAALRGAQAARATGPTACELLDRRLLHLAREGLAAPTLPAATEAVLLIEYEADTPAEARRLARDLADRLHRLDRVALLAQVGSEPDEIDRLWHVREAALPNLYALRGAAQPLPFVEDVGVPAEALPAYLVRVQELLRRFEVTATFLIHAATGQVHMRPFLDPRRPEEAARLWPLADAVYSIVLDLGGTISAQHGTGLARTPWVARQFGHLAPVLRALKAIFDPRHLFNPGKIVGPAPGVPSWPLRDFGFRMDEFGLKDSVPATPIAAVDEKSASRDLPSAMPRQLQWSPDELAGEVVHCNGCGHCRTDAPAQRMCPIFRATHAEAATPRAKANLLRHLLHPGTDPRLLSADEVRAVADLCVNCKMCATECPAHINVPKLMLETKAAHAAEHGLDRSDWVLARTELFARLGSAFAPLANVLLESAPARWLVEKLFGVSRRRRLPAFAPRSFLREAHRRGWTRKPRSARPRVAYFVDIYANYLDPTIAEAVVAVLHHNGIEVYVPLGQRGCGMAPLAYGDVETAREVVQHNLRDLADLAREGFPILCSEPTAAVLLRRDALDLLDDADARLVAAQTVECTAFLWDLHQQGLLKTDFRPLDATLGHHVPCHLKALGRAPAAPLLLSLVPGLRVHTIDVSCSGMAGTFGLKAANYTVSLEAGRPMLEELAKPRVLFGSTECSTCRMQMEDGTGKRTLHPAQYLALAYGLLPDLRRRLPRPLTSRVPR